MAVRLTAAQESAVRARSGRLAVVAGAGSGKTTLLVERYLAHVLEDGLAPSSVLTVTFTRKATAEMRERIVRRLEAQGRPDLAQEAETGPIQTLHAFCERLLRENAFDAELDPKFTVVEGALGPLSLERAFHQALLETADGPPCVVELVDRLGGELDFGGPAGLQGKLYRTLDGFLTSARGSGLSPGQLLARHADGPTVLRTWTEAVWRSLGEQGPLPSNPAAAVEAARAHGGRVPWRSAGPDPEAAELTAGLVHLAVRTWSILEDRFAAERQMDFVMLESRALRLIEENEEAATRLRRTYRALLVDEAQDVNPVQHRLLAALGIAPSMVVGDAAQSIFGFRGAEPGHFLAMPGVERAEPLSQNHRSRPDILRFVDHVFGSRWGADHLRMDPARAGDGHAVEVWYLPVRDSRALGARVAGLVREGWRPGQIAVLTRTHRSAGELAEAVREQGVACAVTGGSKEFFLRLEVRDLANVLRSLADPSDDYAMLAVLRSPLCGVSLDTAVVLASRGPVWAQLEGFQAPLPEDQPLLDRFLDWFGRVMGRAKRLAAWEVLAAVFADSPYLEGLAAMPDGRQRLANARKLLRLAVAIPEAGPGDLAARLRDAFYLRSEEYEADVDTNEDAVAVMTLHASKGLEFDVVVLPDVHSPAVWRRTPSDALFEREHGTVVFDDRSEPGTACRWASHRATERQRAELWRLWYVGMTRARERLCLCVSPRDWGRELAVAAGYPDNLPPYVRTVEPSQVQPGT
jgi:ATP-dependent exoDNAse (exonuclease V) beta subunit